MDADRKFTEEELIRFLRQDLALEEEAVATYQGHAAMTGNEDAKAILLSLADEERVHVGELQALIELLDEDEAELVDEGRKEVADETGKKAWVLRSCKFASK
jgi:rubrerythrin